jgi:glycosyltransferase involved in cell wall biosynthesis
VGGETILVFVSPKNHPSSLQALQFADSVGVGGRFVITGFVEEDELHRLFRHAVALVSPSQMEGFGLPVAQAMRAGTPVITSNRSAQAELAQSVGVLVDPFNVDALADAMKLCLEGYSEEKLQAGRDRAHQYDPEVVTKKLLATYFAATGETRTSFRDSNPA